MVYACGKENGGGITEVIVPVAAAFPSILVSKKEISSDTVPAVVVYGAGNEKAVVFDDDEPIL